MQDVDKRNAGNWYQVHLSIIRPLDTQIASPGPSWETLALGEPERGFQRNSDSNQSMQDQGAKAANKWKKGLDLAREDEAIWSCEVVKRFYTKSISDQKKSILVRIPDCKGKMPFKRESID